MDLRKEILTAKRKQDDLTNDHLSTLIDERRLILLLRKQWTPWIAKIVVSMYLLLFLICISIITKAIYTNNIEGWSIVITSICITLSTQATILASALMYALYRKLDR